MEIPVRMEIDGYECYILPFSDFVNQSGFIQLGLSVLDNEKVPFLRITETLPDRENLHNREVAFRPVKNIPEIIPLLVSAGIIEPEIHANYGAQLHRIPSYLLSPSFYLEALKLVDPPVM